MNINLAELIGRIIGYIAAYVIIFGFTCLGVLFFALAFNFTWNIWLCFGISFLAVALKWIFSKEISINGLDNSTR